MKHLIIATILLISVAACRQAKESPQQMTSKGATVNDTTHVYATFETTMGTFEAELFEQATPKTVKNFVGLAEKGFYNGLIFHRVIDNFMIQGGDPTGTGRGGESIYGGPFEDEFVDSLRFTEPGFFAMANAGPNTNTSQFFITLVATPWLNGKHTIFGKIVEGMDVVQAIGKVKTTKPFDRPVEDVVMKNVTITRK
jgi:cyclophilin family peptidyl-prolyl cis-trans isomerase